MLTNFPNKGDNKKISLKNSKFKEFNYEFANELKADNPEIWSAGGNQYGNQAFKNWAATKKGKSTKSIEDWIVRRERFMERHIHDKNLAGVVAVMKWGGVVEKGITHMKSVINDAKSKDTKKSKNKK